MFVDSHAHLDLQDFDSDREVVVGRARASGVERILVIGGGNGRQSLDSAVKLADQFWQLDASVGIHPHEAKEATTSDFEWLDSLADNPKVVGWGEIGLDYHYDFSPREAQEEVFVCQLKIAMAKGLPVIIHSREAETRMLEILTTQYRDHGPAGVMHCYTGTLAAAYRFLELGFFISFSGILTFPKGGELRDVAREIPLDRLLIETDSPYLAPVPHRGKRNEPAHVVEVARTLAQLRGTSLEAIGKVTTENYKKLFGRRVYRPQATANKGSP